MRRRLFNFVAALSLLLCLELAVQWPLSYCAEPGPGSISRVMPDGYLLGKGIRVVAFHGNVSVYNQGIPYRGSIITLSPKRLRVVGFDFPGICFRHFTWPGRWPGDTYWTLTVWIVYPLMLTLLAPAAWVAIQLRKRRRRAAGLCAACAYNLTSNTSGACPECGIAVGTRALA